MNEYFEILKDLTNLNGGSGDEGKVRDYIKEKIKDKVDSLYVDNVGNLIALKKGKKSGFKLGLLSHMDEVSFMITDINEDGTLSFRSVGGVDPRVVIGKKLLVGEKTGVVGFKPIHLQEKKVEKVNYDQLKIDIGAKDKKDVKVEIGTYVYFTTKYEETEKYATAKAFDDRTGCAVNLIASIETTPMYDTYFIFTVGEEIGLMGASVIMEQLDLDAAIVLEGTTAGDLPELEEYKWATHLGDGPVFTFFHSGYVIDQRMLKAFIKTAEKLNIKYQMKRRTPGGTDARKIATTAKGAPAGVISVPCRYIHSPVSVMNKEDFLSTVKLAKALVEGDEIFEELKK